MCAFNVFFNLYDSMVHQLTSGLQTETIGWGFPKSYGRSPKTIVVLSILNLSKMI
jgi:hypothetical protein